MGVPKIDGLFRVKSHEKLDDLGTYFRKPPYAISRMCRKKKLHQNLRVHWKSKFDRSPWAPSGGDLPEWLLRHSVSSVMDLQSLAWQ